MDVEEEIWCECSDDEKLNPGHEKKGTWEPTAEDIFKLYEELKKNKVLELSWKCPGRRLPDSEKPVEEVKPKKKKEVITEKEEEKKPVEPTEFDFDDAFETAAVITPRRLPGSTPKPQKKVASMQKVLQDLVQKKKDAAAEKEARKHFKSARALGSPGRAIGSPARARLGSPVGSPKTPPSSSFQNRQSPGVQMMTPVRGQTPGNNAPIRTPVSSVSMEMTSTSLVDAPVGQTVVRDQQTPVSIAMATISGDGKTDTLNKFDTVNVGKSDLETSALKPEQEKMDL